MTPTSEHPHTPMFSEAIDKLPIAGPFKRFIVPEKLSRIYSGDHTVGDPAEFAREVLRKLSVEYSVTPQDLARIPKTGPVVVVSNHPFGMLEGLILLEMLRRVRPDVRILANSLLASVPELRNGLILVDPFANSGAAKANRKGVRETLEYLASGGLLVVFPAGEVSHLQLRERRIADPDWNENIARFIRASAATVVPIYIKGANSLAFQLMGIVHAQLRTARLLHELVNKEEKRIELRVGNSISADNLKAVGSDAAITRYLRFRTYLLDKRPAVELPRFPKLLRAPLVNKKQAPVVPETPRSLIERELDALEPLADAGELVAYGGRAAEIPSILSEIGRLREITFRQVGEGTGRDTDLDSFDTHYHHLFVWDRHAKVIVGAYRLGFTAEILPRFGVKGLYTSTLFHFDPGFFTRIGPAIEMGRSFVRAEYQKQYGPLLLLWKAIAVHVCLHPRNPVLFGPVSISNDYHPLSKRLIVQYLQAQESVRQLAALVRPRKRFRPQLRGADNEAITRLLRDSDELSAITADIEPDGKGIPILLKQYLKLGGKLLGFNVDPVFSYALDGLILVDLRHSPPSVLTRYMGRDGLKRFLEYHQEAAHKASA